MFALAAGAADIENTPALFIAYLKVLSLSLLLTTDCSPHVFGPGREQRSNFICSLMFMVPYILVMYMFN
jgi:hypothetical protein